MQILDKQQAEPIPPQEKKKMGNRSTEVKKQKAKSKRARQGQVGQIIKDMYKEAKEVKSSKGCWHQEGQWSLVKEESSLDYGCAPVETHGKCPVTKQASSA